MLPLDEEIIRCLNKDEKVKDTPALKELVRLCKQKFKGSEVLLY
jgi:hypothetical protein